MISKCSPLPPDDREGTIKFFPRLILDQWEQQKGASGLVTPEAGEVAKGDSSYRGGGYLEGQTTQGREKFALRPKQASARETSPRRGGNTH